MQSKKYYNVEMDTKNKHLRHRLSKTMLCPWGTLGQIMTKWLFLK